MSNRRGPQCPSNMLPNQEPAMPARSAPTQPLGSLPGIRAFAKAPTRAAVASIRSRPMTWKLATMLTAIRTVRVQRSSGIRGMSLLARSRLVAGRLRACLSLLVTQPVRNESGDDATGDAADEPARDGHDAKRAADDTANDAGGDGPQCLLIDVRHVTPPT